MTISQMYDFVVWLKNQGQGGYHSPEEIVRAFNSAAEDKFNEEVKQFEATETISSNLRNFKQKATVTLTAGSGSLPADYKYATNAATTTDKRIEIVPEAEWIDRINDPIDAPDADNPICAIRNAIEVRPTSLASMHLYYLKNPVTMTISYTEDGDGNVTVTGGTDCDFPSVVHTDIVRRACVYLGIPLNDEGLVRLETLKKQTENA